MIRAVVAVGSLFIACMSAMAANSPATKPWATAKADSHCVLAGLLWDVEGRSLGRLNVTWFRESNYQLAVSLSGAVAAGRWRLESVSQGARNPILVGKDRYFVIGGETGEQLKRELSAGREIALTLESGGQSREFTSGLENAENAVRLFDQCVAEIKATPEPPPPPPRWTVDTQGGRDCSLRLSGFSGVRGLGLSFGARARQPLTFSANPTLASFKDGGVLRIVLPGDPKPFSYDTEARSVTPEPRTPALLAAIESLKPVDMVFTPLGGKPIALRTTTDGLPVASAMFDACAAALRADALPPRYQFSELRYVVADSDDLCELTGTFQLDGNAIWVTLVSDGKKNVVKVTRRTVGKGYLIQSLGLEHLGGPQRLSEPDARYELGAPEFAALRRDLVANGRDFQIVMSRDRSYTAQFGGALAVVEAPMFEACAHAKFDMR